MAISYDAIAYLLPEVILVVTAAMIYVLGAVIQPRGRWLTVAFVALLVAGIAATRQIGGAGDASTIAPLMTDSLGQIARWAGLVVGILFVIAAGQSEGRELTGEIFGSLLLIIVGLMLVPIAGDLILLFLSLELISIPTYVLLFTGKRTIAAAESTTKYFFLSIFSSALLLYGLSFLYGLTGTTSLTDIQRILASNQIPLDDAQAVFAPLAFVLILAGLGFKITAVPFHFYAPDVYQGTTNFNAGLLAVVPKIAGILAIARLMVASAPMVGSWGWQTVVTVSLLTMTLGNVAALWQSHLRRLLAYSSIAHAGYMLMGLAVVLAPLRGVDSAGGMSAMLLYLVIYAVASIGTFAALTWLSDKDREVDRVDELAGIGQYRPIAAACLAIFMFSLAGIPPLAGFWGKLMLFWNAVSVGLAAETPGLSFWFVTMAVVGVVNAAISAGYYLRIIAAMYFPSSSTARPERSRGMLGACTTMIVCAVLILAAGIVPGPLIDATEKMGGIGANPEGLGESEKFRYFHSRETSGDEPGLSTSAGTRSRNSSPEQRKRHRWYFALGSWSDLKKAIEVPAQEAYARSGYTFMNNFGSSGQHVIEMGR